jgi:hypothetical protein
MIAYTYHFTLLLEIVVCNCLRISNFFITYLIKVNFITKLIALTEDDHRHLVLNSDTWNHSWTNTSHNSTIRENWTSSQEYLSDFVNQKRDSLYQSIDTFDSSIAKSFDWIAPIIVWSCVSNDNLEFEPFSIGLDEKFF